MKGGKEFEIAPQGNHVARVYQIIHVGTIPSEWQGQVRDRDVVRIGFELPLELRKFGEDETEKPMVISSGNLTNTMGEKSKLRPLVEGIIGTRLDKEEAEFFELTDILGMACMINIVHDQKGEKTYARIASAAPVPKGVKVPDAINEAWVLDFNDNWSDMQYRALPDFLKDMIATSKEYKALKGIKEPTREEIESELPF
jgi:hypothetical protein